jgi:hypothetical protein
MTMPPRATSLRVRHQRGLLSALLSCSMLTGCALLRGPAPAREIAVELPVSRTEAVRRTLTAFREQGYPIRSSLTSGLQPESEPFRQGDEAEAVFRATITGTARASRVVLSGTYRKLLLRGVVRDDDEKPVQASDDPLERRLWTRLEQLRLAIRMAPQ